ncbi:GNAT family N-acetyltransferase [Flavobacterium salilacus subsp. salilacus]|uniref:GNAT family N-acetyltransferase n=1 Tax=Flavobacterium TaxID=237 RepID=UPI0010755403|nr:MULTISPECIES: GNAT family N-acetyltransferase [Flavobacterium]KAF2516896.1 GNAT family N-acetyltransferase [Flavobacterium salilacus subsp. salilacus]MBE1615744.1 GNAT family N-acetyltransferase [Flavobacterium sp. SaA2.13]
MYRIEQYNISHYDLWNDFIENSKNGTFLFHRDYMEYHSNRFEDFSLMVFEAQKLVAVFPANKEGNIVYSHKGLTYGGLIYDSKMKLAGVIRIYSMLLQFLKNNQIDVLHIKPVPAIYHKLPAQEQEYVMFLLNAKLTRRDGLSVIDTNNLLPVTKSRKEAIRRGLKNGLTIREESNFELFWDEILVPNLKNKHNAKPVHTVAEITYLHQKFPHQIRHFNVYHEDKIVAGTTMFITNTVAHPQYVSGQEDKNALGSLDYLYNYLTETFSDKRYFDFGPSTEEQGRKLNEGIIFWKESFGARTVTQDFYLVETANYHLLDAVLI